MNNTSQNKSRLRLEDNRFCEPNLNDKDDSQRIISGEIEELLRPYADKSPNEWDGVVVIPQTPLGEKDKDDESAKSVFFTLASNQEGTKTWINTSNCMGVVKLRDKKTGVSVQIEIGSRFDGSKNQFFLTYLLSKVFGGSMINLKVDLGPDSMWDLLLTFVFRHRLLKANAVGLFKQYQTFKHNDARVRGKIDVNEHLRRNIPFCGKVAYSTHEITFNNPTNHLIRHALAKASRKWGRLLTGDGLMDVRHDLEQNTPTWQHGDVVNCIRRRENHAPIKHPFFHAAYEPLRRISLAILRNEGASLYRQHHEAEGVIFDGSWLWEKYLWTLLKPLDFEHTDNKEKKDGWNTAPGVTFYPDFFRNKNEKNRVILDAKYRKQYVNKEVRQDEARQVFCYMFLLNAVHGGLIKPEGELAEVKDITRKGTNAERTYWHDFVLTPPEPGKFITAKDFELEMRRKEREFIENVKLAIA